MTTKTYSSTGAHISFPFVMDIAGVRTSHIFSLENNNTCVVVDPDKQKAIEASKYFQKGTLIISAEYKSTEDEVRTYEKTKRKEQAVVDIALNNTEKSQRVQEATQIGVQTQNESTDILDEVNAKANEIQEKKDPDSEPKEIVVATAYDEVVNINQAKDVLKKLGAAPQSLRNPDMIKKKAEELKAEFPNLKL